MGLLVIAVAVAIARSGQRATPSGHAGSRIGYAEWSQRSESYDSRLVAAANNPLVWTVGFIGLAVAFIAGAVLLVQGVPDVDTGVLETGFLAVGGAVLLGYVFFGAYFSARDRVGQTAAAVGIAAATLGTLFLIGVIVMLLLD
ncbi:hypothetical protein [Natrononativus amylolyticus]|uniref:hypothetical protein n=1 Tax=Natrononativus amylolyticus TaxID=2963434 RepID=UPI0020CE0485|nr:hypothetical protein [Natrononativus amylolyticus]